MSTRRVVGSAIVLLSSACASVTPVREYLVGDRPTRQSFQEHAARAVALNVVVRPFLDSPGIGYRQGTVRAGAYHYHRWAEPLDEMIFRAVRETLNQSAVSVVPPSDTNESLQLEVSGFHETADERGRNVRAIIRIDACWRRPGRSAECFTVARDLAVDGDDIDDLVETLDRGLYDCLDELVPQVASRAR